MSWKYFDRNKISMERCYEIIRRPLVTEKFTRLSQFNQMAFEVAIDASKSEIKQAIEKLFKVKVKSVNTVQIKGKTKFFRGRRGSRSSIRKAIVTLNTGQTIDLGANL